MRPWPFLGAAALSLALGAGCAGTAPVASGKYPRRGPGCEIGLYQTAVPPAAAWDDLGIAEIGCHVSSSRAQCLQLLKAEGCRMGGDMIYNVPREPLRPSEQVQIYRGQVAHTILRKPHKESDEADLPPPASKEEASGPVVPLTGRAAPPSSSAPTSAATATDPTAEPSSKPSSKPSSEPSSKPSSDASGKPPSEASRATPSDAPAPAGSSKAP